MNDAPIPIDVHAVVGDEAAAGKDAIALRAEIFRLEANAGTLRCPRLQDILVRNVGVVQGGQKLGPIHLGSRERVL